MPDSKIDEDTNMRAKRTRSLNCTGQALVEMAIILPLLLLLVMGIFEFGRAMYIKNTLTHAARAGARAAVVTPGITATGSQVTLDPNCNYGANPTGNNKVYATVCSNIYNAIDRTDVGVEIQINEIVPPTGLNAGDMVEVLVTLNDYHDNYRIVSFIPVPDTFTGTTAMRYE